MADRDLRREGTRDQAKGAFEELKGKVRGDLGDAFDNSDEHFKGRAEELKGKVRRKVGEAKEDIAERDKR